MAARNTVATVLGMLGGGFEGFADAKKRKMAEKESLNTMYNRGRANELDADRIALDREQFAESRSNNAARLGLDERMMLLREAEEKRRSSVASPVLERALRGDREAQAAAIIAGLAAPTDFVPRVPDDNGAGARAAKDREDEQEGLAYISAYQNDPEFSKALKDLTGRNPEMARRPGLAAFRLAQARRYPPVARDEATATPFKAGGTAPTTAPVKPPAGNTREVIINGKKFILPAEP